MNDLKPPRVWCKTEKKMYIVNGLLWIHGHLGSIQVRYGESLNPKKAVLLMSTGLQDKNGKEVYQHGVYLMDGRKFLIVFKEGQFVGLEIPNWKWSGKIEDLNSMSPVPAYLIVGVGKYLGNIYESPNLLEEVK